MRFTEVTFVTEINTEVSRYFKNSVTRLTTMIVPLANFPHGDINQEPMEELCAFTTWEHTPKFCKVNLYYKTQKNNRPQEPLSSQYRISRSER